MGVMGGRWVHYMADEWKTLCGKDDFKVLRTLNKNDITCKRCIEVLKLSSWYCDEHGFIDDVHVTNSEDCELCGQADCYPMQFTWPLGILERI